MSTVSLGKATLIALSLVSIGAMTSATASAQSRINDKVSRNNGAPFFANQRASRNIQHARDYSRSIRSYTNQAPVIAPNITRSESEMLGMQLQNIRRDVSIVGESHVGQTPVVEQVKVIQDKLAHATTTHKMLHEECCKDAPDGKVCSDLATKLTTALDDIAKDHAKLMKLTGDDIHADHKETK